jgi:putrescine aminotransferase
MPVGGVVATAEMFAPLNDDPLLHSSTFAGSPLASAAVTATIDVLRDEGLIEASHRLGPVVLDMAREAVLNHCPGHVHEVRGQGLLVGIDFVSAAAATEFLLSLLERRVIPSYSLNSHHVLRLTPPAVLEPADLDWLAAALTGAARDLGHTSSLPSPSTSIHPEEMPCAVSSSG